MTRNSIDRHFTHERHDHLLKHHRKTAALVTPSDINTMDTVPWMTHYKHRHFWANSTSNVEDPIYLEAAKW